VKGGESLENFYTCEEVASRLGVKVTTVWSWIKTKKLPAIHISGKYYRVVALDLEAFEKSRRTVSDENGNETPEN